MNTLNYVRQCVMYFDKTLKDAFNSGKFNLNVEAIDNLNELLNVAKKAVKFISPEDGRIFNDNLKGLPDELNLPYPVTAIEFERKPMEEELEYKITGKGDIITKIIAIATQLEKNVIDIKCLAYSQNMMEWIYLPFAVKVSSEKYDKEIHGKINIKDHYVSSNGYLLFSEYRTVSNLFFVDPNREFDLNKQMKLQLYYPLHAVLELIEALTCSNVGQTTLKNNKPIKNDAYPFDEYKVLTVKSGNVTDDSFKESEQTGTCPREHLRRGHVRTYKSGLKIWIQSMTINAGIGGKILKEYSVDKLIVKTDSSLIH